MRSIDYYGYVFGDDNSESVGRGILLRRDALLTAQLQRKMNIGWGRLYHVNCTLLKRTGMFKRSKFKTLRLFGMKECRDVRMTASWWFDWRETEIKQPPLPVRNYTFGDVFATASPNSGEYAEAVKLYEEALCGSEYSERRTLQMICKTRRVYTCYQLSASRKGFAERLELLGRSIVEMEYVNSLFPREAFTVYKDYIEEVISSSNKALEQVTYEGPFQNILVNLKKNAKLAV